MANQRSTFAKREREMKLKEKARIKAERLAARRAQPRTGHGPPIATPEEVALALAGPSADAPPEPATPPEGNADSDRDP